MTELGALPGLLYRGLVATALAEDLGRGGDLTAALVGAETSLSAEFRARRPGRVAGLGCARAAFELVDGRIRMHDVLTDGADAAPGDVLARVEGPARSILTAERTALNFLGRLSGVATLTRTYVEAARGFKAVIVDTRKTTPGLRALEKYAVRCGGGVNHRFGLDDAILIKDNHVAALGGVRPALEAARRAAGHLTPIEIEVDTIEQLREALEARPDVIMLDNFSLEDLRAAVALAGGRVRLEASGGVTLETVRDIAATGVDAISVGALTHSAPVLDIGLDA